MKAYAFETLWCIYEGNWEVETIYKTKKAAYKAKMLYDYKAWQEHRVEHLMWGNDYNNPFRSSGSRVQEYTLED
jgi:hypothetical protein